MDIASFIRHVPDYPKPGILFYDITPLLASPEAVGDVIERMADAARPLRPTRIVAAEARGFLFAAPLAQRLGRRERLVNEVEQNDKDLLTDESDVVQDSLTGLPSTAFNNNDDLLPPQSSGLETKVEYLQVLAQSETERVAEVLKQWINSNDRSNSKSE